jgi:hypothetical protein
MNKNGQARRKGKDRVCIFCGKPPQDQDLEHPLPMWLLRLTGDPNRVVQHGVIWNTGKPLTFSFDSLKFPACAACNRHYSQLESRAKAVVEAICAYVPVPPLGYVLLLDWLDKVRVGLWLGNLYLQKSNSATHFVIANRIGAKDRMVAVYALTNQPQGLNTWGTESPLFLHQPSVFTIRINNMMFLNASWDWMCSGRCGYPAPLVKNMNVDYGAAIAFDRVRTARRVLHPVIKGHLPPALTIVQPVAQLTRPFPEQGYTEEDDAWCLANSVWPGRDRQGPLFLQSSVRTTRIDPDSPAIGLSVDEQKPVRAFDLAAQAYDWGIRAINSTGIIGNDLVLRAQAMDEKKAWIKYNRQVSKALKSVTQEEFKRLWIEATGRAP